jgi:hypothetical protein
MRQLRRIRAWKPLCFLEPSLPRYELTITQFVPLLTRVAHEPDVAPRIDVPAAPPVIGTTFEDAEFTAKATLFVMDNVFPRALAGDGNVRRSAEVVFPLTTCVVEIPTPPSAKYTCGTLSMMPNLRHVPGVPDAVHTHPMDPAVCGAEL